MGIFRNSGQIRKDRRTGEEMEIALISICERFGTSLIIEKRNVG